MRACLPVCVRLIRERFSDDKDSQVILTTSRVQYFRGYPALLMSDLQRRNSSYRYAIILETGGAHRRT